MEITILGASNLIYALLVGSLLWLAIRFIFKINVSYGLLTMDTMCLFAALYIAEFIDKFLGMKGDWIGVFYIALILFVGMMKNKWGIKY